MSKVWILMALAALLLPSGMAHAQQTTIRSQKAVYENERLTLSGEVILDNEWGLLCANSASLSAANGSLDEVDQLALGLQGEVYFSLDPGNSIHCDGLDLDLAAKKGTVWGTPLTYSDTRRTASGQRADVSVRCKRADLALPDVSSFKGQQRRLWLEAVDAQGEVAIGYAGRFQALCDRALMWRQAGRGEMLRLMPSDSLPCRLKSDRGDRIEAAAIEIEREAQTIALQQPQGTLLYQSHHCQESAVEFRSEQLLWKDLSGELRFFGKTELQSAGWGRLFNDGAVCIQRRSKEGKTELKAIQADGPTQWTGEKGWNRMPFTLICDKKSYLDHDALSFQMESEAQPVLYRDDVGEIRADRVAMHYGFTAGSYTPTLIVLEGCVCVCNTRPLDPDGSEAVERYVYAQRAEYAPHKEEILLWGGRGEKVLYLDKLKGRQLSADCLRLTRDGQTKEETCHADGRVRIEFNEEETCLMKQRFLLR